MSTLLLPSKVEFQASSNPNIGTVVITPCFHGYGTTLGNGLRRVLLSSLPGAAVEAFKIKGVSHEFSGIPGVKEDAVEIVLNLKQLAVKVFSDEKVTLKLTKKGPGAVTAKDIEPNADVEIENKDLVIANLTDKINFEMEIIVGRGRGFKPVEEKGKQDYDLGTMVIDSTYSPIKDVGYNVEYTRVGDVTDYEKLHLTIETNGTITPQDALQQATQILMDHYSVILENVGAMAQSVESIEASSAEEAVGEETVEEKSAQGGSATGGKVKKETKKVKTAKKGAKKK